MSQIKKIAEDWNLALPLLSMFSSNKFYKTTGCCVIGVELIKVKGFDHYRPHFVIYPLWKKDVKSCFESPIVLIELHNKKGVQFSIPYLNHNDYFMEAIHCLNQQFQIIFDEKITVDQVFQIIDNYSLDILIRSNSNQLAKLSELKLYLTLFIGNQTQVKDVLNLIKSNSKNWDLRMFEMWYGSLNDWLGKLEDISNDRESFMEQLKANLSEKKLSSIIRSQL